MTQEGTPATDLDESEQEEKKLTVLVVEDEDFQVKFIKMVITDFQIIVTSDVDEAIAIIKDKPIDLVLMDLNLNGRSGFEILEFIHDFTPDIPAIIITAYGDKETAIKALKHGAYDFIEKPFGKDSLLVSVARAVERRRLFTDREILIQDLFDHAKEMETLELVSEIKSEKYEKQIKALQAKINQLIKS